MSSDQLLDDASLEEAVAAAMDEGKRKGLPDGWKVTIDKRKRRKWISPNGRSCDSIPKALTMSVELGLLPPDTQIPVHRKKQKGGTKKRPASSAQLTSPSAKKRPSQSSSVARSDMSVEYDAGPETDPETSLDIIPRLESSASSTRPSTVHWDPESPDGRKVGWKIKIWDSKKWNEGRIVRYDPYSHKHKIQYDKTGNTEWLRLMNEVYQCATRLVWAHVKGFPWWPGMVMLCDPPTFTEAGARAAKEGYVFVTFFGSDEVATLKDSLECVRPFQGETIDPVIAKHKKKRNANAFSLACQEQIAICDARNEACRFYASKAFGFANKRGLNLLGKRIELFRSDVNYPYGDTVVGVPRAYSTATKKWLLSYEISDRTKTKYDSSWVNLQSKDCKYKVLDKKKPHEPDLMDLVPFVYGFERVETKGDSGEESLDMKVSELLSKRCHGCIDYILEKQQTVTCASCSGKFHVDCVDGGTTGKAPSPRIASGEFTCAKCTPCVGCSQHDIVFGAYPQPIPSTLTLPPGASSLDLCSMCVDSYDDKRYCPNCAHAWNDKKYQKVKKRRGADSKRGKKKLEEQKLTEQCDDEANMDEDSTVDINPSWYHPDTPVWGYTEGTMLICDGCDLWVHAACGGLTEDEYTETSEGEHPIYSKEFLCRCCCKARCRQILEELRKEDKLFLFAVPVTEEMAPTYADVIKNPMDLRTMGLRAERDEYLNYAWIREDFELMVLNALTFNRIHTKFWDEAKRYYGACLKKIFSKIGKGAPPGRFAKEVENAFHKAEDAKRLEAERVQEDDTTEKKDLVAGSDVGTLTLPPLAKPLDQPSCLPYVEVALKPVDAYFASWMECCFSCGSSGATDTMLFCVDCGECYHSFCANAPIHSMDISSVSGWRCPNCKICEISGEVPQDETRMIYCEMCDRAFSLDLIDPRLEEAPEGLWICGQCIDCKSCSNTSNVGRANLKHWSSDPEKCYRCGGCKVLFAAEASVPTCQVCLKYWRNDDADLVTCSTCNAKVHEKCDVVAQHFLRMRLHERQKNKYSCPSCRRKYGGDREHLERLRRDLYDQTWMALLQDLYVPDISRNILDDRKELCVHIDSTIKNMWREEYETVVREGCRILEVAKTRYVHVHTLFSHFDSLDLPIWMGQRAARFIRLAQSGKLDVAELSSKKIGSLVVAAKLASAFLKVGCRALGIKTKRTIKCYDKMMSMLEPPDDCGFVSLKMDVIKVEGNANVIQADEWNSKFHPKLPFEEHGLPQADQQLKVKQASLSQKDVEVYKVASPLLGWNDQIEASDSANQWADPRECCLCHMCGDDDAGFSSTVRFHNQTSEPEPGIAHVGRLLPTRDGLWVHASCALWSSEVYEAATGGEIHSMEKARSRGSQLKCFGCGRHGATVGCSRQNCSNNYHFPCAKACGAVFTASKGMFCAAHTAFATEVLAKESFEHMKTLTIAPEKTIAAGHDDTAAEARLCARVGCIVVHALGKIDPKRDDFHSEKYIFPQGYFATRIFWSAQTPRTRTVYILKVDLDRDRNRPIFSITPGDDPENPLRGCSADEVYSTLTSRVKTANRSLFSKDVLSKLPVPRKTTKKAHGLNGPQFFGFGLDFVRKALEQSPGAEAVAAPLTKKSVAYNFCFHQPPIEAVMDLQRKRAAVAAEQALENASGSARTEGMEAVTQSTGSGRITRALVRSVEDDIPTDIKRTEQEEQKAKADRESNQRKYNELKSAPLESRLVARRSHIHGWGLFTKVDLPKDSMIVEYMGETVYRSVADKREKEYEKSGIGSCYMFRLDLQRIVDATMIGCMARFMNHCCRPNAYAKIISVDTELGPDKKIVVFSNRDIAAGEEITYDYKFPVEDGSLKCTCGAPNCIGRMN